MTHQWSRWRELLLRKLREAESETVAGDSIDLTDVTRPREPPGSNTVTVKLKTIQQGQDAYVRYPRALASITMN